MGSVQINILCEVRQTFKQNYDSKVKAGGGAEGQSGGGGGGAGVQGQGRFAGLGAHTP